MYGRNYQIIRKYSGIKRKSAIARNSSHPNVIGEPYNIYQRMRLPTINASIKFERMCLKQRRGHLLLNNSTKKWPEVRSVRGKIFRSGQ